LNELTEQFYMQERQPAQIKHTPQMDCHHHSPYGTFWSGNVNRPLTDLRAGHPQGAGADVPRLAFAFTGLPSPGSLSTPIVEPLEAWAKRERLPSFAYRTSTPWQIFVLAGRAALGRTVHGELSGICAPAGIPLRSLK